MSNISHLQVYESKKESYLEVLRLYCDEYNKNMHVEYKDKLFEVFVMGSWWNGSGKTLEGACRDLVANITDHFIFISTKLNGGSE